MAELKPCPFCGGYAELRRYTHGSKTSYTVRCRNKCVVTCGTVVDGKWKPTSMTKALEKWNRRADNGN